MPPSKNGSALTQVEKTTRVSELHILTVEELLGSDDIAEEVVRVPEWGGAVRIRAFSKGVEQRLRREAGGTDRFELLLFITGVVEPAFTLEQTDALKSKNAKVFDRVVERIMSLAGLTKQAVADAKATFPPTP